MIALLFGEGIENNNTGSGAIKLSMDGEIDPRSDGTMRQAAYTFLIASVSFIVWRKYE
jgi:hypothetical protein